VAELVAFQIAVLLACRGLNPKEGMKKMLFSFFIVFELPSWKIVNPK
jgi:hypothetical protein